eukprot:4335313-Lingulodinium_polyedra.AAC.1
MVYLCQEYLDEGFHDRCGQFHRTLQISLNPDDIAVEAAKSANGAAVATSVQKMPGEFYERRRGARGD